MDIDFSLLLQILIWLVVGGGAGRVAAWLTERVSWLGNLTLEYQQYARIVIAGLVAVAAYALMVRLGYQDAPENTKAWIEAIVAVLGVAVLGDRVVFTRTYIRSLDAGG